MLRDGIGKGGGVKRSDGRPIMKVCAVVPTYNRQELLERCLRALLRQTRPLDEIIVIDNASTDGTSEMIRGKFAGQVTYLGLRENMGSAGGFCQGMKLALQHRHDWIWCMDNDAVPLDDTLQKLIDVECPSKESVVAKACSRTDPETGERYTLAAGADFDGAKFLNIMRGEWRGRIVPVECAPWGGLLVKADAVRRAGFPEVGMFSWGEDVVFCFAIRKFGEILHTDSTMLFHRTVPKTVATIKRLGHERITIEDYWKQYYFFRNMLYIGRAYFKSRWRWTFKYLKFYLRGLASILLLDDFKLYRIQIITRGLMDGLRGRLGKRVEPSDFTIKYGRKTS